MTYLWTLALYRITIILFGLFYRPSNANANHFSNIEDSISLAADVNINDIIITVDFNFNQANVRVPSRGEGNKTVKNLHPGGRGGNKTVKILLVEFMFLKFTNKPFVLAAVI